MFKYLVLCTLIAASHAGHFRIVNGTNAEDGEFPFAAVLRRNGGLTCGSTILNENFVLTAGHCACDDSVPQNDRFSIQYGYTTLPGDNSNVINVARVNCNPRFSLDELIFDSAVLELESPIPAGNNWERVTLTRSFDTSSQQSGVVIGWGRLSQDGPLPETLQKIDVNVYDNDVCGRFFDNEHHICFGSPTGGACNGDSGTALLVNGQQAGIASFITDTCGLSGPNNPNVYARVATYFDWIVSIAGDVNIK